MADLKIQKYLTVAEVAKEMSYSVDTVRKWCQSGRIAAIKLTKKSDWRILPDYKERWLDNLTRRKND